MQEKYIEQKLVATVKSMGGMAPKFVSPGIDGMPDRIVLLPMGRIAFVECKATGFLVYCLDDVKQIGGILSEIQAT